MVATIQKFQTKQLLYEIFERRWLVEITCVYGQTCFDINFGRSTLHINATGVIVACFLLFGYSILLIEYLDLCYIKHKRAKIKQYKSENKGYFFGRKKIQT